MVNTCCYLSWVEVPRPLYCPDHANHQSHERKSHVVRNGPQGLFHLTMYLMKEKRKNSLPLIIAVVKYILEWFSFQYTTQPAIDSEMNACPLNPVTISSLSFLTVMARSLHSKLSPDLDILSDSNKPARVWKNRSTYTFKCALKTFAVQHAGFLLKRWPNFTFIHTQMPTSSKETK